MGVVEWELNEELAIASEENLKALGADAVRIPFNQKIPDGLALLTVHGPYRSLAPLATQLLEYGSRPRPGLILTLTEQLPAPWIPEWIKLGASRLRAAAERIANRPDLHGTWSSNPRWAWLTGRAHRFLYYGELCWLRETGLLSALVVSSRRTAAYLSQKGFDPLVPPSVRLHPRWGTDLGLERTIPVLWIGKVATARRQRILARIRKQLNARGVELMMVDGVQHPYLFGEERTQLLNRTKIVLNILREPWDDNSMRYHLAMANGALIVSEPTLRHTDFIPGRHMVEARVQDMADTLQYYLTHEQERSKLVRQAVEHLSAGTNTQADWTVKVFEHALARRNDSRG